MFSTFFYILILFYQNLYSGLGYNYNRAINKVNLSIVNKDYQTALSLIYSIENNYILNNINIYQTKVILLTKGVSPIKNFPLKSSDDFILKSFTLSKIHNLEESKKTIREGLKLYPEKDTLIKLYELFSFLSKNNIKNVTMFNNNSAFNNTLLINDSKLILDLLRKNEKFLQFR